MATVKVYNLKNQEVGSMELPDSVFKTEVSSALIHQAIVTQLAGRRRGTAATKTKAEVRGGGRKPFKQKGTGNARQGSTRSPLMPGGGESFGPRPRSYFKTFPKKMAQSAVKSALSDKLASDRLVVIQDFDVKAKTKDIAAILVKFGFKKSLMVDIPNEGLELAARNLRTHKFLRAEGLNVFDLVNHEWLMLSQRAATMLGEKLSATKSTKSSDVVAAKSVKKAKASSSASKAKK